MYPEQPPVHWGGAIMWRGSSDGVPVRTGASFVGLGSHDHRFVCYPISAPDPGTGRAQINWIAEITVDNAQGLEAGDWNHRVAPDEVIAHFEDWNFDWLDVPALIRGAPDILKYPMVDRDPVPSWQDGRAVLLGDAAHPMYPTGSNGATQAIVDARMLGQALLTHGVGPAALSAFDDRWCKAISEVVLRNRGAGPFGLLKVVDARCGGVFDDIDSVMPAAERADFLAGYKRAAGYAIETLNAAPRTIPEDARVGDAA